MRKIYILLIALYAQYTLALENTLELSQEVKTNQDFEEKYEKRLQYLQIEARHCTSSIPLQSPQDYGILSPKFKNWQVENYPFECYWLIMHMIKNQNSQALTQFHLKLSNPRHTIPKDYIPLLSSYDLVNKKGDIYPQIYALFDHSAH